MTIVAGEGDRRSDPQAVFFTLPLALLAIGSELDPEVYEVVVIDARPGPWVCPEKFRLIERFKFFHELAWKRMSRGKRLLQQLARHRCDTNNFRWPVEMLFTRWILPTQRLS
jgi:hypothetical protein